MLRMAPPHGGAMDLGVAGIAIGKKGSSSRVARRDAHRREARVPLGCIGKSVPSFDEIEVKPMSLKMRVALAV
jgi:hypothetical protein